ncbi:MAG: ABC transporter ATP-binding protein [Deltaproteobacteria bacterium]|nr:ABC transporter ATP-binding protein [Deltaproteobacteria bacterium]
MSYIRAENLMKIYGQGEAAVTALRDVSFGLESGDFISIMGESGSGKSTMLSIMGALNTPSSGKFLVEDIDVYALKQEQRADFRREFVGFIFQSFNLIPYLTVVENVMLPLTTLNIKSSKKRVLALDALGRVGLSNKADRLPSQISGGEQERVAIARAIVNQPPMLLADEPTGNLDSKTGAEIMDLLRQLNEQGMTVIMVTHNIECARYARRLLRMADGMMHEEDPVNLMAQAECLAGQVSVALKSAGGVA